jgi:L-fuconolactonase
METATDPKTAPGTGPIDAHHHLWNYDAVRDAWITEEMGVIRRDFTAEELFGVLTENGVSGSVVVQADTSEEETAFLVDIAGRHDFIKGVVGWVDLSDERVEERLAFYRRTAPQVKGFRHIVQAEPDRFLDGEAFRRGVSRLRGYGYTYDILVYPRQLEATLRFVDRFADQPFVLDHLAKPDIRGGKMAPWEGLIRELATRPNVYCKVSGMITEADWAGWTGRDLTPYLDVVFEAFGTGRLMFGSDWPVCLVAGDYRRVKGAVTGYLEAFPAAERQAVMSGNAARFYGLH